HTRWPRDWSSDVCSSDSHDRDATRVEDVFETPLQGLHNELIVRELLQHEQAVVPAALVREVTHRARDGCLDLLLVELAQLGQEKAAQERMYRRLLSGEEPALRRLRHEIEVRAAE